MFTGLFQPTHIILLVVIMLVVLGPKKLPEAGRAIGHGIRELKGSLGSNHDEADVTSTDAEHDRPARLEPAVAASGSPDRAAPAPAATRE